jgi:ankyrin repeat protein
MAAMERLRCGVAGGDVAALSTVCRELTRDVAALSCAELVELVRSAIKNGVAASSGAGAGTLDALLGHRTIRQCVAKISRLQSLCTFAIKEAPEPAEADDSAVLPVVAALTRAGVDVTSPGWLVKDATPLIAAAQGGLLSVIRHLVTTQGADVNGKCKEQRRWPLRGAAFRLQQPAVNLLLELGANPGLRQLDGSSDLHMLACLAHLRPGLSAPQRARIGPLISRLVEALPALLDAPDLQGASPAHAAATAGCEDALAALITLGADVGAVGPRGDTPLSAAVSNRHLSIVRQLIAAGAASRRSLPRGSPQAKLLAHTAVSAGMLWSATCGQCAGRCGGRGPGSCGDGLDILRAVLAAGVQEEIGVGGGSLAFVVLSNLPEPGKPGSGATAAAGGTKGDGATGGSDAERRMDGAGALAILRALHEAGWDLSRTGDDKHAPPLLAAVRADAPLLVRWLVEVGGCGLEVCDANGYTPLLAACRLGAWAAAHALLDLGARADVCSRDRSRGWPITLAAVKADSGSVLKRLLAADADSFRRVNASKESALHEAAAYNAKGLQVLLNSGLPGLAAAIDSVSAPVSLSEGVSPGCTPLHFAMNGGRWDAAVALLRAGARVDVHQRLPDGYKGPAGSPAQRPDTVADMCLGSHVLAPMVPLAVKALVLERATQHRAEGGAAAGAAASSSSSRAAR